MDKKFLYKIEFENEEEGVKYCLKKGVVEKEIRRYKLSDVITFSSRIKERDSSILSNMYHCDLYYNGLKFNSLEQAYHYFLFDGKPDVQSEIMRCKTSFEVKKVGKKYVGKDNFKVLEFCMRLKYKYCKEFRDILVKSGDKEIVEYAEWGDVIYGCCKYGEDGLIGQNACGRIMMKVREDMRNK
jgi:predicted NAD-dependent protein-ADP-ribosyltransferase YbiA (DUF1768 family)